MSGPLVLVVDDDPDIRGSLCEILGFEGYRTVAAIDGLDALARLRLLPEPPALILLDMMMPRLDGRGFLEALTPEERFHTGGAPVVVVTADRAAGLDGVADVLQKPFDLHDLLGLVARWTKR
jgi:two-component system response regulator MprA